MLMERNDVMQTPTGIFGNKWATLVTGSALLLTRAALSTGGRAKSNVLCAAFGL